MNLISSHLARPSCVPRVMIAIIRRHGGMRISPRPPSQASRLASALRPTMPVSTLQHQRQQHTHANRKSPRNRDSHGVCLGRARLACLRSRRKARRSSTRATSQRFSVDQPRRDRVTLDAIGTEQAAASCTRITVEISLRTLTAVAPGETLTVTSREPHRVLHPPRRLLPHRHRSISSPLPARRATHQPARAAPRR